MSEDRPVVSAEIPEFTGNLEQLEKDAGDIAFDGMAVGAAGLLIDANFNLLEPFYKAPEADQLFATTAAAGQDLQTELGTVSKALLDYAAEVRPLVDRLNSLREEAAAMDAAEAKHSPLHGAMLKQSELFGERVAEHHAIPERYPGAKRVDDGAFGNNRFDQIYERPGGGYVVVEAKGSLKAGVGERTSLLGNRVEQGTREYFETILNEMDKRAAKTNDLVEAELAGKLRKALVRNQVDYVLIKADATQGGKYAGYEMKQFNIGKPRSQ